MAQVQGATCQDALTDLLMWGIGYMLHASHLGIDAAVKRIYDTGGMWPWGPATLLCMAGLCCVGMGQIGYWVDRWSMRFESGKRRVWSVETPFSVFTFCCHPDCLCHLWGRRTRYVMLCLPFGCGACP